MCGARFAVFARRARVLPSPSQTTRNLSFLEVSPAPITLLFQVVVALDWYGLVGTCANVYAHVPLCHEHEWRTVCRVGAYGARVVHHFLSNS